MGQSALILTLAATFTIVIILILVSQNTRDSDEELAQYHYKVLAREVASTGLNMTVRRLVDEPYRWSDPTWPYEYTDTPHRGGTFTTTVTGVGMMVENFYNIDQDTVDVVSMGAVPTPGGVDTTHVIEARYVKGYQDFGLPPAFRKAVFADSVLTLNGNINILHSDPTENALIHGNDGLRASGAANEVYGLGTVSNDPDHAGDMSHIRPNAEAIFDPPQYTDGDELVYADAPIHLPQIDASAIDQEAHDAFQNHVHILPADMNPPQHAGDLPTLDLHNITIRPGDFPCAPTCGTQNNPLLYYVPGNLDVNNLIVEGYVQFVVDGRINFQGGSYGYVDSNNDGTADPEPTVGTDEWDAWINAQLEAGDFTKVGYYAEGIGVAHNEEAVKIAGNFSLVGQIYTNGDVKLGGGGNNNVNIFGGVTSSSGNVDMGGGITIRFAMLSNTTLLPGLHYIVPEGVRLIAYAEW